MLKTAGFKIKLIVARINYAYQYGKFEVLLNKITDWGNAIEVERLLTRKQAQARPSPE